MNRSPSPLRRWPPAPRSPSSNKAPVMSEPGITSPVGWNCTISMSRRDRPARYASAMPSAALSAEHAARREERDARGDRDEAPRPDVEDQRARRAPRAVAQQLDDAA